MLFIPLPTAVRFSWVRVHLYSPPPTLLSNKQIPALKQDSKSMGLCNFGEHLASRTRSVHLQAKSRSGVLNFALSNTIGGHVAPLFHVQQTPQRPVRVFFKLIGNNVGISLYTLSSLLDMWFSNIRCWLKSVQIEYPDKTRRGTILLGPQTRLALWFDIWLFTSLLKSPKGKHFILVSTLFYLMLEAVMSDYSQ